MCFRPFIQRRATISRPAQDEYLSPQAGRSTQETIGVPKTENDTSGENLGTTVVARYRDKKRQASQGPNLNKWQALFHSLPTEVHERIVAHLDPASQMCFGLTGSHYMSLYYQMYPDHEYFGGPVPMSLNIRFTADGLSSAFARYHYDGRADNYGDVDATDPKMCPQPVNTTWHKSLIELLWNEDWLWGDRQLCYGCEKFKKPSLFASVPFDKHMQTKFDQWEWKPDCGYWEWFEGWCLKCREKEHYNKVEKLPEMLDFLAESESEERKLELATKRKFPDHHTWALEWKRDRSLRYRGPFLCWGTLLGV